MIRKLIVVFLAIIMVSCIGVKEPKIIKFKDGSQITIVKNGMPDYSKWNFDERVTIYAGKRITIYEFKFSNVDDSICVHTFEILEEARLFPLIIAVDVGCYFRKLKLYVDYPYLKTGIPTGNFEPYKGDGLSLDDFIIIKETGKLTLGGQYEQTN